MKKMRHTVAFGLLAAALSAPAFAGYAEDVAEKFSRGLCNSAFGWVEFGKNLYNEPAQHGPLYAPVGLMKGIAHTVGRTVTGAIDTASFMIPSYAIVNPGHVWENMETETSYGVK